MQDGVVSAQTTPCLSKTKCFIKNPVNLDGKRQERIQSWAEIVEAKQSQQIRRDAKRSRAEQYRFLLKLKLTEL